MQKTIAISINSSWNILNFRRGLIEALQGAGYRVVALSPLDSSSAALASIGVEHVPLAIDSLGLSPVGDLGLLFRYYRLLARVRPDVFLGYTAKPNIYGSLAAHALNIPVINNISGLGTAFIEQGLLTRIVSSLYRVSLRRSDTVFFQNPEDRRLFVEAGLVKAAKAQLLPGSGIDLNRFTPGGQARSSEKPFTFLLVSRLLWQKGIGEYVETARLLRGQGVVARVQLLGFLDVPNRSAVKREQVQAWVGEGLIDYLGETNDVRPFIAAADCIVLPSYREGLPRSLLEGAAMGKPLIATDVPGCRQIVQHGINGFLCKPADASDLARAMLSMSRLPPAGLAAMGAAARLKVEQEFGESGVLTPYLKAVERLLGERSQVSRR